MTAPVRVGFPGLGFDPAPGSLPAVSALSESHSAASRALADAGAGVTGGGSWQGDAAVAFRTRVAELPARLDAARHALDGAASILVGWHGDLASMKRAAEQLDQQAVEARGRLDAARAHPDLGLAGRWFDDEAELRAAADRLADAEASVARAQADLDAVLRRAEELRVRHGERAMAVEAALRRAAELAPDRPGPLDGFADLASGAVSAVRENAHLIAAVSDVTADVSTMVGLAGLALDATGAGAPVGVALGVVSGGLSAAALGGHALAAAGGAHVAPETFFWDTAGVATLGTARAVKAGWDTVAAVGDTIAAGAPIIQAEREERLGDGAATIYDNLGKYWAPRDLEQWGQLATAPAAPAAPVVIAYRNAIADGMAADEQARRMAGHVR